MGRRELIEALRRKGREKMADIAARGTVEEERLRSRAEERREELLRTHEQQRELLCNSRKQELIAKATREAALIRLRGEHALSLRLHERAINCLKQLRSDADDRLFHALVSELPEVPWRTVLTNPGDTAAASVCFPHATIIVDENVSGGLKAMAPDDCLTVDNTLEKRLERLWPDLLPLLMAELKGRRV